MARKNGKILSSLASRLTATVSVTLVLMLLGLTGAIGIATRALVDKAKEELGFVVIMNSNTSPAQINAVKQALSHARYTAGYTFASPAEIEQRWVSMTGADSLERSMLASFDVSPFRPEFDVNVKSRYIVPDSLERIIGEVKCLPGVDEVTPRTATIEDVSTTTSRVMVTLLVIAAALIVISFVLINNTVRLSVYSRRFVIHTMSLVGATNGFIRRPFLLSAAATGVIAGAIADVIYLASMLYLPELDPEIASLLSLRDNLIIAGALPPVGVVICALAALFATNRYLRQSYDQLFD